MSDGSDDQDHGSSRFEKLFSQDKKTVELMEIRSMAEWFKSQGSGRLRLPPIQRSLVWRNEQIVNYWDSLMRGYPAGMMMVTRVKPDGVRHYGRGLDNKTEQLAQTDFQLFDGQQRLAALLLGLGEGTLARSLKIWIDIGRSKGSGDRLFEIRINSTGQPFGYKADAPNEKVAAEERRRAHQCWPKQNGHPQPPDKIFKEMATETIEKRLSSARCAVSLSHILNKLMAEGKEAARSDLQTLAECSSITGGAAIDDLLKRLQMALDAEIVVKLIDGAVLDGSNYELFFGRLGQGGTRLSDEELIYSLIKDRYPKVHDRVDDIVRNAGRFASEVDLVLGALHVAQTLAPLSGAKEWEKAGRPTPDRVRSLHEKGAATTEPYFRSLLPDDDNSPPRLKTAIEHLRIGLLYDKDTNPRGLPSMLLARFPRDLLDVLLLFTFRRGEGRAWAGEDRTTLVAFVLYWLIFVAYDDKAAYDSFVEAGAKGWCFGQSSVAALLCHFESAGISRHAPRASDWPDLKKEVENRGCTLAKWAERFSSRDVPDHASPGEALRVLSTNPELQRRALIWLQRHYITRAFQHYDPTSTRDDDLPFDLDHAIPQELFGFHWKAAGRKPLDLSGSEETQFKDLRHTIGNSLGNLRWLAAADNRARGMGQIEDARPRDGNEPPLDDHIDRCSWNKLMNEDRSSPKTWTRDDVATFQRLIDCRTLLLAEILMKESGIMRLIDIADCVNTSPSLPGATGFTYLSVR